VPVPQNTPPLEVLFKDAVSLLRAPRLRFNIIFCVFLNPTPTLNVPPF
jgi:hypothetical protein